MPEDTVYRWAREHRLPAAHVHGQYRFNRGELLEWAQAQGLPLPPELAGEADTAAGGLPSFADALAAGGVFHGLAAADKETALRSVVAVMKLDPGVDRQFLLQVLLAREGLASTGIGGGIAIPHVRNPIVLSVRHPAVCLCFLEAPVEFGAVDGQPVHTLFTLVSPTVRVHLYLLSRLALALRQPDFAAVIARRAPEAEVLAAARAADARPAAAKAGGVARP